MSFNASAVWGILMVTVLWLGCGPAAEPDRTGASGGALAGDGSSGAATGGSGPAGTGGSLPGGTGGTGQTDTGGAPGVCGSLPPAPPGAGEWQSSVVFYDNGELSYATDDNHHRVPDYSYAGYHYGMATPPEVAEVTRVAPSSGDDTQRIQDALDRVGNEPANDDGFRGAVVLEPGTYEISGTLRVNRSGVVLRGSGDGDDPTRDTILVATGDTPHQRTVIVLGSGSTSRNWQEVANSRANVTNEFVQVGALSLEVDNPTSLGAGDRVVVRHPSTAEWIAAVDGGGVINDPPWSAGSIDIVYYRRISNIDGNTLSLDAPIYNHLDRRLSQAYVVKSELDYVPEVGVENLRVAIETAGAEDENHAWNAIGVIGAEDAWVRGVTALHFGYAGVLVTMSTRITVDRVKSLDPVAIRTGGRMYNLSVDHGGQLVLFSNCEVSNGRHGYVTNGTSTASGVVFYRGRAISGGGSEAGHRRWATGILYDNLFEQNSGQVLLMNRGDAGSSHGWGAAHSTVWNYNSEMVIQQPPTAQNYAVSEAGHLRSRPYNPGPDGHIELNSPTLVPNSLYEAQLCERLRKQ